ncbi:UBC-like protein [Auriculariales sp. MPI-PUGE-AT-0066]|nr:UBC-like protein [Auriculariales sp. MPI-PUGE-AT-0066]
MATRTAHNKNNSAVKRILQEARELANDPSTDYVAAPLEDDIFEWHCTLRGSPGTEFEGGLYHVRILLPAEYPFRPPSIMLLTPNGRFELNTKICISFTNYHEEQWQPAWGVRTAIIGLQGFFPLKGEAAVGVAAIEYPASERRRLAQLSRDWTCPHCKQSNLDLLPDPVAPSTAVADLETAPTVEVAAAEAVAEAPVVVAQPQSHVLPLQIPIPSPAPDFIARMPAGPTPGPLTPAERPGPPDLALTAAVGPFAPQAPVYQQAAARRPNVSDTQRVINLLDAAIAFLLACITWIVLRRFGIADAI